MSSRPRTCSKTLPLPGTWAGLPRGGTKGDNELGPMEFTGPTRGPMTFRGPMGLRGAHHRAQWPHRADRNDTDKSACGKSKTFFFFLEITSKSGKNWAIFLFCFGPHKTRVA